MKRTKIHVPEFFIRLGRKYFGDELDFGLRAFNTLAIGGTSISFIMAILCFTGGNQFLSVILNTLSGIFASAAMYFVNIKGHYKVISIITVTLVFIIFFPVMFFSGGGYLSGMPSFFIFAWIFTVLMLDKKILPVFAAIEFLLYTGCCVAAYLKPEIVNALPSDKIIFADITTGFLVVCAVLGTTVYFLFRTYKIQQKKLDERNLILARMNQIKAEFISDASHELKTPLTVVSVNVQRALDLLTDDDPRSTEEAHTLLQRSQDEIMRLGRMVTGSLNLASVRESFDKKALDCVPLIKNCAETWLVHLKLRGNSLVCDIPASLPGVFCDADQIVQVISNLISNSNENTENGTIKISAGISEHKFEFRLEDNGNGISPELLPHIFERSVSGRGGTGYGLCLCQAIINSHGGSISVTSDFGKGTSTVFTIPLEGGN